MELNFENWLFENKNKEKIKHEPWKEFKTHVFTDYLKYLIESDKKILLKSWEEEVKWKENGSDFEANLNPYGSLRITCRKFVKDFEGNTVKVCKYVYPVNDFKINQEEEIAYYLYNKIKKISSKNIDYPKKEYNLKKLAQNLFSELNITYPKQIMFPTKLVEVNENYYKLVFEFKGQGVGVPGSNIGLQFNINLSFDKNIGFIRCWGNDITSPSDKRQFILQPSEWDEYFSPKQNKNRIIDMIKTTFMTY